MNSQKIFFSYSRIDGSAFALRLAVDLKKKGFDVWIDQEDIRAGTEWDTEIEKALETCDCVLFLETEKSVVSNNVLDEVYYALEQNKKVIPLIYVDSKTPFRLKRLQHINFTKDYDSGLALLMNELESNSPAVTYPIDTEKPMPVKPLPFYTKHATIIMGIAALVILAAAGFFLTSQKTLVQPRTTQTAGILTDSGLAKTALEPAVSTNAIPVTIQNQQSPPGKEVSTINKKQREKKLAGNDGPGIATSNPVTVAPEKSTNSNKLATNLAGNWRLTDVEPKAESQRGYIKVEPLDENKASIKSYIQFYYPTAKATSYLTVFNAFAGCSSCLVSEEMKLVPEDVAIGSRTIQTLQQDQPDGRKAGDVVLNANSNKSIRTTVTLQLINNTTAVIKIRQPVTIELAYGLILAPFEYTFRFKKDD